MLELRQVALLTSNVEEAQERHSKSITQTLANQHDAISSFIGQQYKDLNDRLNALGRLIVTEDLQNEKSPTGTLIPSESEANAETIRIAVSHRVPCRNWCPCVCHTKRKVKMTLPAVMASLLGTMFVGYTGMPVVNKPCDFRGCRDRQSRILVSLVFHIKEHEAALSMFAERWAGAPFVNNKKSAGYFSMYHIRQTGQHRRPEVFVQSRICISARCQRLTGL